MGQAVDAFAQALEDGDKYRAAAASNKTEAYWNTYFAGVDFTEYAVADSVLSLQTSADGIPTSGQADLQVTAAWRFPRTPTSANPDPYTQPTGPITVLRHWHLVRIADSAGLTTWRVDVGGSDPLY
jgi:hypothetical protein